MRLEAEQVTKQYQTDPKKARFTYALSGTDLVVESGEFAVITGKIGKREIHAPPYPCRSCFSRHRAACWREGKICTAWRTVNCQSSRNENIAVIPQGGGAILQPDGGRKYPSGPEHLWKKRRKRHPAPYERTGDRTAERRISSELSGGGLCAAWLHRESALFRAQGSFLPTSRLLTLMKNTDIVASSSAGRQTVGKRFLSSPTRWICCPMPIPTTL